MFLANGGVPTCKDEYNILIFQVLSLLTTEIFYMNISPHLFPCRQILRHYSGFYVIAGETNNLFIIFAMADA